mmetsp:Transcript_6581/g.12653  ORF Transcript_6581/g.12653 Transcript_6581/m.12653 type:complete len:180 (+) Transcript_6581:294-833(+)|eukprot:scaffold205_cov148-Amphora_coffeaeformis.AAC.2
MLNTALDYITPEFRDWIETRVYQPNRVATGKPMVPILKLNNNCTLDEIPVTIQKVKRAPSPTLFYAANSGNDKVYLEQIPDFIKIIPDKKKFGKTLGEDILRVRKAVESYPILTYDFQLLIDLEGNAYHIDIDGGFGKRVDRTEMRPSELSKKVNRIAGQLRDLQDAVDREYSNNTRDG